MKITKLGESMKSNRWLALPMVLWVIVSTAYLISHNWPAGVGGLFLDFATQIEKSGFQLPARIPHYTGDGLPFVYPPLTFYLLAGVISLNIPMVSFTLYMAPITYGLVILSSYIFGIEYLSSKLQAALVASVMATSPIALRWHIGAGGVVRNISFTIAILGLIPVLRSFSDDSEKIKYVILAGIAFGLVLLSHLVYAYFFVISCIFFYVIYDRSADGLKNGVSIALIGTIIAIPWLLHISATTGFSIFFELGVSRSFQIFWPVGFLGNHTNYYYSIWVAFIILGGIVAVLSGRIISVLWFSLIGLVMGNHRFLIFVGGLIAVPFLLEYSRNIEVDILDLDKLLNVDIHFEKYVVLGLILFYAVTNGALWAHSSPEVEPVVSDHDRQAFNWVKANTDSKSTFAVLSWSTDWFPYMTNRTNLIPIGGAEWQKFGFSESIQLYREAYQCRTPRCFISTFANKAYHPDYPGYHPDYIYFRGESTNDPAMKVIKNNTRSSKKADVAYENERVLILKMNYDG